MSTIFSKIIAGDIPCCKLYEDERFFAFLDIRPVTRGHALLVPKEPHDYIFDLPEELLAALLPTARPLARAIERVVPCERVGLIVAGLEVPHTHLHLIPIREVGDLNFANARPADPEALQALAEEIGAALEA